MNTELVQKLEVLLQTDDITSIKTEVRDLMADVKAQTAKDRQIQLEKWEGEEHEEGAEFHYLESPEKEQLDALMETYRARVKEHGKKIADEQRNNLNAKNDLLNQLQSLIKEEENVGKAFATFKEIEEKLRATGDVPGDQYREFQERFTLLKNDFYYNINIYKELQENDLKINLRKKEDLIGLAKDLLKMEDVKEIDLLVRSYQKQWSDIGPSPRENWKEIGDEFFGVLRESIQKIQAHYDSIRSTYDANLQVKRDLVDTLRQTVSLDISNHGTWTKKTEEVIQFQKDWKTIGFAPKKENEEVWQEFRGLCDLFFEKKNSFYDQKKSGQKESSAKKKDLIEQADALKESTDWKTTTDAFLKLQNEWKTTGTAAPGDERKLWERFRAACDVFFNAKKENFAGMDERQAENKIAKLALIEEIKAFNMSGNQSDDLKALKAYQAQWNEVGYVPKRDIKSINEAYYKAIDGKYDNLKIGRREKSVEAYKGRIENLKNSNNGERDLTREKRLLHDKIDRLKQNVMQYETNISIFTGPGAEALKKDIEKKIRVSQAEIDEIKSKLKLLSEA